MFGDFRTGHAAGWGGIHELQEIMDREKINKFVAWCKNKSKLDILYCGLINLPILNVHDAKEGIAPRETNQSGACADADEFRLA